MKALLRTFLITAIVLSGLALHRPTFRVMAELVLHDHGFEHLEHSHTEEGHTHKCGCLDCPENENGGDCHRIDCCDSPPLTAQFQQVERSIDEDLLWSVSTSLLNETVPFSLEDYRKQAPRDPPGNISLRLLSSFSQVPNAPPSLLQL